MFINHTELFFYIVGYLISSIPFGLVFTKLSGMGDIRDIGSGNIGATNVLRTGNKKIAIATLVCDFGKSFLIIFLAKKYAAPTFDWFLQTLALISILGHIFPLWLKFKGGKGVATATGAFFAVNPMMGLFALSAWIITLKIFKISSLSALVGFALTPFFVYAMSFYSIDFSPANLSLSIIVSLVILFTHRDNIKRLIHQSELTV